MHRIRTLVVAAVAAAVLIAPASAPAATKLVATVGPGFNITLTKGGKKVTSLKAGKYTFVIRDKSDDHNFHLKGPGVNKATGVEAVGTKRWTVTLKKGKYTYVCDPHVFTMKGSFTVR